MKKVLVIEDEHGIRETLLEIINLSGCLVSGAKDATEGIELISQFSPDLVFCDIELPGKNGFDVLEWLNTEFTGLERPQFYFLTASVNQKHFRRSQSLGADGYILKPFDVAEIMNILKE